MTSLTDDIVEKISFEVIRTLVGRFQQFPSDVANNRNAPFHEAFLKAFSNRLSEIGSDPIKVISLSSWLHGLNTTIGQQFFEKVAHILSNGEKRAFNGQKISQKQKDNISSIITKLKNGEEIPNLRKENNLVFLRNIVSDKDATNFTADVFIHEENRITAIELKSVKPNSGEMKNEKQKILEGKAVLKNMYPYKDISYMLGFPFDPTVPLTEKDKCSYDVKRFMENIIDVQKYFAPDEILIASGLWDFLSGCKGTMQQILGIINSIATVDFMDILVKIKNPSQCDLDEYTQCLTNWNLHSELEIVHNHKKIKIEASKTNSAQRQLNNSCFDDKGEYNISRYMALKRLI